MSRITGNAVVSNSQVAGCAMVGDNAVVCNNSIVSANAVVGGNAYVSNARVGENAVIMGTARVYGGVWENITVTEGEWDAPGVPASPSDARLALIQEAGEILDYIDGIAESDPVNEPPDTARIRAILQVLYESGNAALS
jgi:hypothetical protein